MVYRPTVRYHDVFRDYVNKLFHATTLDRNQIIRAALFAAAHSNEFYKLIDGYKKSDVPLPSPIWEPLDHELWMEQCKEKGKGGRDVNAKPKREGPVESIDRTSRKETTNRRIRFKNSGGIKFSF
ncbi:hypothetical protein [Desertibacillus haloalkaliphilus]|uniref:hypothetical protein n=1 Tax=Desertibacillus haloalkaliphilus TaxID=1328930 RepID=UPI001C25F9B6|nr:hypothetical protein [Desertibacillus haloalkaliphilus]MBU8905589.1 hypothetical protein [Desertibacillus haloalkaliphilus]